MDVAAEAERTRRALQEAQVTTLGRKGRLHELHRRIAAAESEEREAAKAAAKAQLSLDRVIGTATAGASAGPTPSTRRQSANSQSTRPGDEAFLDGSVQLMDSSPHVEFAPTLGAALVAKASVLLTSVRRTSFNPPKLLSVRRAWSEMDHSS